MSEEITRGRPEKIPDRNKVVRLAAKGLIQEEIAALTGVCVDTLVKHCSEELKRGILLCNASLRSKQVKKALAGDTTQLIWLGKNRLGQADKQEIDVRKQTIVRMVVGIEQSELQSLTNGYFAPNHAQSRSLEASAITQKDESVVTKSPNP